jgi:cysteinyl-tRNA synthetase
VGDSGGEELLAAAEMARSKFIEVMDDDFNAARAIGHLFDLGRAINQARDAGVPASALATSQNVLRELAAVLGLTLQETRIVQDPVPFRELATAIREELIAAGGPQTISGAGAIASAEAHGTPTLRLDLADGIPLDALADTPASEAENLIDLLVSVRSSLRTAREYVAADRIRTGLADLGIVVEDAPEGSTWRVSTPS